MTRRGGEVGELFKKIFQFELQGEGRFKSKRENTVSKGEVSRRENPGG